MAFFYFFITIWTNVSDLCISGGCYGVGFNHLEIKISGVGKWEIWSGGAGVLLLPSTANQKVCFWKLCGFGQGLGVEASCWPGGCLAWRIGRPSAQKEYKECLRLRLRRGLLGVGCTDGLSCIWSWGCLGDSRGVSPAIVLKPQKNQKVTCRREFLGKRG